MALALIVAVLLGGGIHLIMRRGMLRVIVGFTLLSHGVNVLLLLGADPERRHPPIGTLLEPGSVADPVPQSLVLTAIVISFAVTILLLALSVVGEGDDDTEIELEGRRMETPDLIDEDSPLVAPEPVSDDDWRSYVDRADDDAPIPSTGATEAREVLR